MDIFLYAAAPLVFCFLAGFAALPVLVFLYITKLWDNWYALIIGLYVGGSLWYAFTLLENFRESVAAVLHSNLAAGIPTAILFVVGLIFSFFGMRTFWRFLRWQSVRRNITTVAS